MTDLPAAIRAKLDQQQNTMVLDGEFVNDITQDWQGALLAVLEEHQHVPENGGEYTDHDFGCSICHIDSHCGTVNGYGWCTTVRIIAEKLEVGL